MSEAPLQVEHTSSGTYTVTWTPEQWDRWKRWQEDLRTLRQMQESVAAAEAKRARKAAKRLAMLRHSEEKA